MTLLQNNVSWRQAFKITIPILMGYLAAGIAYGILATNAGLPYWLTIAMSLFVFSGTAQYAAIPFFVNYTPLFSIFLSTLLMSLRFIFYTINIRQVLPNSPIKKWLSLWSLTDEGFALLSSYPAQSRQSMVFKVNIIGLGYWVIATIIGMLLGDSVVDLIPHLDFALPCLFAILAYEQYTNQKQWKPIAIALISFMLAKWITQQYILLLAILISMLLVLLLPTRKEKEDNAQ